MITFLVAKFFSMNHITSMCVPVCVRVQNNNNQRKIGYQLQKSGGEDTWEGFKRW